MSAASGMKKDCWTAALGTVASASKNKSQLTVGTAVALGGGGCGSVLRVGLHCPHICLSSAAWKVRLLPVLAEEL